MENQNYEQIVREAAKWLDSVEPGWYKKINRGTLDIGASCSCVMGQLYGDYSTGMFLRFPHPRCGTAWDSKHPLTHAFNTDRSTLKTKLWLREIDARLEADLSSVVLTKEDKQSGADKFITRTTETINQPVEVAAR